MGNFGEQRSGQEAEAVETYYADFALPKFWPKILLFPNVKGRKPTGDAIFGVDSGPAPFFFSFRMPKAKRLPLETRESLRVRRIS